MIRRLLLAAAVAGTAFAVAPAHAGLCDDRACVETCRRACVLDNLPCVPGSDIFGPICL